MRVRAQTMVYKVYELNYRICMRGVTAAKRKAVIDALDRVACDVWAAISDSRNIRLEVHVSDRGGVSVIPLHWDEDSRELNAARRRGAETVARILSGPDMLTGEKFAALLGVTRMAVHKKRKRHELLGLEGAKRGIRYPRLQLDVEGRPVQGLSSILGLFGDNAWGAYRFLLQHHSGLGKRAAIDALKAGRTRRVIDAAQTVLSGDFS
jgi:hypothetical protein